MRSFTLRLVLLLLVASAPVRADPGGDDAPNDWRAPREVPLGTHEGTVGGGDHVDWYSIVQPPGKGIRVDVSVTGGPLEILLTQANGNVVDETILDPAQTPTVSVVGGGGGEVHLALWAWPHTGSVRHYVFTATPVDLPDVAVVHLEVRPLRYEVFGVQVEDPTRRFVDVEVANVGTRPLEARLHVGTTTPTDNGHTTIGEDRLALAPGEQASYTLVWDATGLVGDVEVLAAASLLGAHDLDPTNNGRRVETHAAHPGDGQGVTILGAFVYECLGFGSAYACVAVRTGQQTFAFLFLDGFLGDAQIRASVTDGRAAVEAHASPEGLPSAGLDGEATPEGARACASLGGDTFCASA